MARYQLACSMTQRDGILETARGWLIEEKVGLIARSELVDRVDAAIAALETPPYELIALSLGESLAWSGPLDLVLHRVHDRDAARLARTLLSKLGSGALAWDELEAIAMAAARLIPDSQDAHAQFMAIAEGLYVARELGVACEPERAEAVARLERMAASAA